VLIMDGKRLRVRDDATVPERCPVAASFPRATNDTWTRMRILFPAERAFRIGEHGLAKGEPGTTAAGRRVRRGRLAGVALNGSWKATGSARASVCLAACC